MKPIHSLLCAATVLGMATACQNKQAVTVAVCNTSDLERPNELIEVPMQDVVGRLNLPATAALTVWDEQGRQVAWENDLVAFRTYSPALQASGERGYGYDLFAKRGTDQPVLPTIYKRYLDADIRARIDEARKTDPKTAGYW